MLPGRPQDPPTGGAGGGHKRKGGGVAKGAAGPGTDCPPGVPPAELFPSHAAATLKAPERDNPPATNPSTWPKAPGYQVVAVLGRGGMGIVYKAWQERAHRLVALKVLRAGAGAGPQELARFRTEAEAIARMEHPNIVHLYDVGEHDGQPFFTLEYVEATSLTHPLPAPPLPPPPPPPRTTPPSPPH